MKSVESWFFYKKRYSFLKKRLLEGGIGGGNGDRGMGRSKEAEVDSCHWLGVFCCGYQLLRLSILQITLG